MAEGMRAGLGKQALLLLLTRHLFTQSAACFCMLSRIGLLVLLLSPEACVCVGGGGVDRILDYSFGI